MNIVGKSPYGIYGSKMQTRVGKEASDRATSLILGVAEGAFSAALWLPMGFKERHPVWGTLFGVGSAFNFLAAAMP